MYTNKIIKNFKISNDIFAKYLKEKNLVLETDNLVEIAYPVNFATTLNFPQNGAVISYNFNDLIKLLRDERKNTNFIYNGILSSDVKRLIYLNIATGAFNTGICTQNDYEYSLEKKEYLKLKNILEKCNIDNTQEFDEVYNDHKIYMLSYRAKRK